MELEKIHLEKINKYDYQKMMKQFKFQDSLDKLKQTKIKKIKSTNAAYKRNVSQMLSRKQETEDKRISNIKKELTERNKIIQRNKSNIQKGKDEELMKAKTEREAMNQSARCNFNNHFALLEEKRLLDEKRILDRMQAFKDKYVEVSTERKISYAKKRMSSMEKHKKQHQMYLEQKEHLLLGKEEMRFNKFYESFWNQRERKGKAKENLKKKQEKYIRVVEVKSENEHNDNLRKKRIMKKLNDIGFKCKLLRMKQEKKKELSAIEEQKRQMLVLDNIFRNQKEENTLRQGILNYQREIVSRSVDRENALQLKKLTALESIVLDQIEFERKLPQFSKDIKLLQEESILKKDLNKRKEDYKKLLRIEYERRKKEKEDKQMLQ